MSRILILSLVLIMLTSEFYTILVYQLEGKRPLPALYGNFEHVRDLLKNDPEVDEFSFAVVGDTRSTGTFERIAEQLNQEPVSFLVILGGFVDNGTDEDHAYFRAEIEEFGFKYPVFFVVGNHDVRELDFSVSRFEEVYGPTNFSFVYQDCLFVFLQVLDGDYTNIESLDFARTVLSENHGRHRKTFVLTHIPPPVSTVYRARRFQGQEELVSLMDQYKVDYLIAGDYHGYAHVQLNNTTYLVTGGGGSRLKPNRFSRFHHAVVITVSQDTISERILAVERDHDLPDKIEKLSITRFYPWLSEHWLLASFINISIFGLAIIILRRHR